MLHSTTEWQSLDSRHFMHPFTDTKDLGRMGTKVITTAKGVYLWDSEGNQIIDGMAGLWCVNVGYGREELAKAAYEQLKQLPYYNSFFKCTHPPAIELSEKLAQISPPQFNHVFYVNSGSEANDTVLRMVRNYWKLLGQPQKRVFISRINGYHGSTVAGASLGGQKFIHDIDDLPIPDIVHIEQPYWYQNGGALCSSEYGILAAQELEKKINELGIERVAAFIGEPIQGAGGVIVPPETYWPEIQRICDKYKILLIADEVICGFGRIGHWFGSEYFKIKPDLMPIAKGLSSGYLPIGGVMVSDRIADIIIGKGKEFAHGFTYSGHPAACVVATRNLEIIEREGLVEQVRNETGPYLGQLWEQFKKHPLVGEVRTVGLLGAIELVDDKSSRRFFQDRGKVGERCRDLCVRNGLVMRAVQDTMILSPPLVATRSHLDEIHEKASKTLNQLAEELGRC